MTCFSAVRNSSATAQSLHHQGGLASQDSADEDPGMWLKLWTLRRRRHAARSIVFKGLIKISVEDPAGSWWVRVLEGEAELRKHSPVTRWPRRLWDVPAAVLSFSQEKDRLKPSLTRCLITETFKLNQRLGQSGTWGFSSLVPALDEGNFNGSNHDF